MQNKRVMFVVLALLTVTVVFRLKDILPERMPVAVADVDVEELHSPSDLEQVHKRVFAYLGPAGAGAADRPRRGGLRLIPESRTNPFSFAGEEIVQPMPDWLSENDEPEPEPEAPLACTTIHLRGLRSQAIIANRTVSIGDTIRGFEVKHIDEQGVLLNGDTEILFLPLRHKPDKKSGVWIAFDEQ